jgi:predicted transcriptional regulator of viral defense system
MKNMQYLEIKDNLRNFVVFSIKDVLKVDPSFHKQRFSEWQKKGYIRKIAKGYYIFSDLEINEAVLFIIANRIFEPSYVSLEMALSYYGLIPESVYGITSVSSKRTYTFKTKLTNFTYHKTKSELMFGYRLIAYQNHNFKIAEIEKAILDYFYFNSKLKTKGEFEELRFNKEVFKEKVDMEKTKNYLSLFNNKSLEKRVNRFIKYLNA